MTRVPVVLHVHERQGSADSRTPAGEMVNAYKDLLGTPLAIGFVGHDSLVRTHDPEVITIDGIEYEYRKNPRRLHVVNLTDHDYRYLAHPAETAPHDTKKTATRIIEEYDLDGVEKYNGGFKQYDGDLPVTQLAGDDAHSPTGTGLSYMLADVPGDVTEDTVVGAIKSGDFDIVNNPSTPRSFAHQVDKGAAMVVNSLRGGDGIPWDSVL